MTKTRYLAIDLETVKLFPRGADWQEHRPLGIGCAVAYAADLEEPLVWHGIKENGGIGLQMSQEDAAAMVRDLQALVQQGYTPLTWNGLGFDFHVLAEESGMWAECRELARAHVDMMFHLFCVKGYRMGLANACAAMDTKGKTEGMDGEKAVQMWHDGKREAVIAYCTQDVAATLDLALACEERSGLSWTSQSRRPQNLWLPSGWENVERALLIPEPSTSWMDHPQPRSDFSGWLDESYRPDPKFEYAVTLTAKQAERIGSIFGARPVLMVRGETGISSFDDCDGPDIMRSIKRYLKEREGEEAARGVREWDEITDPEKRGSLLKLATESMLWAELTASNADPKIEDWEIQLFFDGLGSTEWIIKPEFTEYG